MKRSSSDVRPDGANGDDLGYNWPMRFNWVYLTSMALQPGVLVTVLLMLALPGCSQGGPGEAFEQYQVRLARTLAVTPAATEDQSPPGLPAPRAMHLQLAAGNIGALDFLALSGCAVQITIGKRNSSLGRLARDSQSLLLDLEYLQLAPACIDYQRKLGESELADTLEQAWELKRRQLPAAIYNATLGGDEYREFWKKPAYPDTSYPGNTSSAVIVSLEAVNNNVRRWLAGDFTAANRGFEILLGEVATGDGGALMQALAAQAGALDTANRTLQQRLDKGPLCYAGIRPAAADILPNVVGKYFIEGIQPRAAELNRRYHELLPPLGELEEMLKNVLPGAYETWRRQRAEDLARWVAAPRQHIEQLQALQQPCTG